VRRCLPLFAILAVFAIPVALLQVATQPGLAHVMDTLNRLLTLPPADTLDRARIMRDFNRSMAPGGGVALFYAVEILVYPLARTALVVFAARTLDGVPVTVATAYRDALPRWAPQIFVSLAFIGIALALGVAFFFTAGCAVLAIVVVGLLSRPAAIALGVVAGLALIVATIVVVALAYIAWLMASVSVAVEDANPVRAVGHGLRRALDRSLRRRNATVALAVLALDWFGSIAFIAFGAVAAYLTRIDLLYAVTAAFAGILLDGLRTVFVLIYMRDVQLRREGSDLLLAASAAPQMQ
jgi:hypothetical protein